MNNATQRVIKNKLGLLNLAEELKNVSQACKIMGVSRDTFYRYQQAQEETAIDSGMDSFLTKPYKAYQLYALIQDLILTRKQIRSALSASFST